MQTIELNDGKIKNIGSMEEAFELIRDDFSFDLYVYLSEAIDKIKEDRDMAIDELQDCTKIYKAAIKMNNELSEENDKCRGEIEQLKSKLYKKSTQ